MSSGFKKYDSSGREYFDVTVSSSALPTGASTSANQTNGTQQTKITDGSQINTLKRLDVQVVNSDIGMVTNTVIHGLTTAGGGSYVDVKVTPSGALSTATTLNDGTDTALITAAGELNVLATAQPGVDIGDVTINNASGASAVNIQDGGNSITVDGSVSVIGTTTVKELRSTTGTNTSVSDSASSVTILASNANRLGATVSNDSSAALYLLLGSTSASLTNYSARIAQYGYYEVPFGYTGQLTGIWATDPNDGAARVTEIT